MSSRKQMPIKLHQSSCGWRMTATTKSMIIIWWWSTTKYVCTTEQPRCNFIGSLESIKPPA